MKFSYHRAAQMGLICAMLGFVFSVVGPIKADQDLGYSVSALLVGTTVSPGVRVTCKQFQLISGTLYNPTGGATVYIGWNGTIPTADATAQLNKTILYPGQSLTIPRSVTYFNLISGQSGTLSIQWTNTP